MLLRPPSSPLFPTRRSSDLAERVGVLGEHQLIERDLGGPRALGRVVGHDWPMLRRLWSAVLRADCPVLPSARDCFRPARSEEHTSELQSRGHLVCRLLLEKK